MVASLLALQMNSSTRLYTSIFFFVLIITFYFQELHHSVKKAGIEVQELEGQ